jgi:hypothetical protein
LRRGRCCSISIIPNIFFFDQISKVFEDLIYLYPMRPVVQVVASMMRHRGVMSWYQVARDGFRRCPSPSACRCRTGFSASATSADLDDAADASSVRACG